MSGVVTAATIATVALGAGQLVQSISSGHAQAAAQKKALTNQQNAQQRAETATLAQRRSSETAQNKANMKTPDIAGILARAAQSGASGLAGTMLTGPSGVNPAGLNLGKTSLLGQ